jgi:hypothetical protein
MIALSSGNSLVRKHIGALDDEKGDFDTTIELFYTHLAWFGKRTHACSHDAVVDLRKTSIQATLVLKGENT